MNIIPVIQDSGVYMLYDKNDDLIYIGHTQNINQRLQQHCKNDIKD
jgi:predicted GIY-YIG superfamily endonuclease